MWDKYLLLFISLMFGTMLISGCKDGADAFFSGRPSDMAMVHNRIIGGNSEAMINLLKVPSRFPDATESHIALWQNSIIAWWRNEEKHELMKISFKKISKNEMYMLREWVRVRDKLHTEKNSITLDEIEAALNVI